MKQRPILPITFCPPETQLEPLRLVFPSLRLVWEHGYVTVMLTAYWFQGVDGELLVFHHH